MQALIYARREKCNTCAVKNILLYLLTSQIYLAIMHSYS
nr:MAG TPA: hypothetical protein [Caudoviricetes sp.]